MLVKENPDRKKKKIVKSTISGWIKDLLKQSAINVVDFKVTQQGLHLLPKSKCPDCLFSRFLKRETGRLNLHGRNFIITILKRGNLLKRLFWKM